MAKTRIGDTVVADGGNVKWGVLASIIVGTPVYAYFEGFIGLLVGYGEFLTDDLLGGVRSWVVGLIELEISVGVAAIDIAWMEFWRAIRPAGALSWFLSIIAVVLVIFAFVWLVRKGVSVVA